MKPSQALAFKENGEIGIQYQNRILTFEGAKIERNLKVKGNYIHKLKDLILDLKRKIPLGKKL